MVTNVNSLVLSLLISGNGFDISKAFVVEKSEENEKLTESEKDLKNLS